jgi:hypothetical protein
MRIKLKIIIFCLLFLTGSLYSQKGKESYSASTVLASGEWYKIAVTADGIYRIDYSRLRQLGLVNPSNPRIFCNNPGQLSYYNNNQKTDDLKELAIYISTGSDGLFNEGDYLLFYGKNTHRWIFDESKKNYNYLRHNYSDTAFYFLTSSASSGKRVTAYTEPAAPVNFSSSESDLLFSYEQENENLIKSGREWFQKIINITINPGFTDLIPGEEIKYQLRVAARASVPTVFRLYEGAALRKSIEVQGINLYNYTGTYAQITDSSGVLPAASASPVYQIKYFNNGEGGANSWLDYFRLQGRKSNIFTGLTQQFSDSRSAGNGRITNFSIKSQVSNAIIWDITDPLTIRQISYTKTGDNFTFKSKNDSLRTFIAFTATNAVIPEIKTALVPNQDLHGSAPADMIIVTHPMFRAYAQELADIHLNNSGLISQVVSVDEIYNEFSGGIADIAAIRNFVRMKYQKQLGTSLPLKYLLLFGDGSYENKTLPPDNPNFIPTYQSQNSNVVVSSFTSDDFYGLLEDGEGEADGTEDIGIGRLPVKDTSEAAIVISKIVKYLDPANMGDWKNIICLTADDEDGNAHMSDAEGLAAVIKDSVPSYNIDKIYLDAYRQTTSVNGQSYPEVNKAISDRINAGCLIFNYTGHGSETGLAHERVVKPEEINSWKNGGKLPLFVTATCEFSRFDDIELNIATHVYNAIPSAGEMVLLNKSGGAIALMSTTRVVYSAPNFFLNRNIYKYAFTRDENGNTLALGDIIRIAKNKSGNGPNKRNFSLLGDPALKLAYPWYGKILTDSINNISVLNITDTLKAQSLVTVSGHIENENGSPLSTFNGVVTPLVYDKENKIKTLANDGGQVFEFNLQNNILFSGKTLAKNGRFSFSFIIPKDINYSFGPGKISYYASDDKEDMNGYYNKVIVGGFASTSLPDTSGPLIKLYMNDTLFRSGGLTDANPKLLAVIEDNGGINTTGAGIGHDITGYLDNLKNSSFVLNSYYVNDFDSFMRGQVVYDLTGLSSGSHSLTLKAWDNFNNSSEEKILFFVETGEEFVLRNLFNYPNPFPGETSITVEHNRPEEELNATITIYSLNGRVIKIIKTTANSAGYELPPVKWDGNDDRGNRAGQGIYPYSVIITTEKGETAKASGRMIIL